MTSSIKGSVTIVLIPFLCLIIIVLLIIFAKVILPSSKYSSPEKLKTTNGRVISPSLSDINSGIARKDVSFNSENTYLIKISRKPNTPAPQVEYVPQYLTKLLELPNTSRFTDSGFPFLYNSLGEGAINWDTCLPKPSELVERPFKRDYYLLLPKGALDLNKIFEDGSVTAKLEKPDVSVFPFLNDNKYCQKDSDCHVDYNFCSYGGYNYFKEATFGPYGCGQANDADFLLPDGQSYTYGALKDPKLDCFTTVKYASASCLNHRCTGQGRTVSCSNN